MRKRFESGALCVQQTTSNCFWSRKSRFSVQSFCLLQNRQIKPAFDCVPRGRREVFMFSIPGNITKKVIEEQPNARRLILLFSKRRKSFFLLASFVHLRLVLLGPDSCRSKENFLQKMNGKREDLLDARPIEPSSSVVYAVPVYAAGAGASTVQQTSSAGQSSVSGSVSSPPLPTAQATYVTGPGQSVPHATVVALVQTSQFGAIPARIICPFCGAEVITGVKVTPSITAHLWALGLCIFGCIPCCIAPYFVKECQSHIHVCPNCNHEVGYHGL
jgi:lipopolysaccharide-induced tumor necrosis factor-alpha factor